MNLLSVPKNLNRLQYCCFFLGLLLLVDILVLLDIPVIRQVSGYVFLTFVPGWLMLRILKLDTKSLAAKMAIAVGLSVFLLLILSVLVNWTLYEFGYARPLTTGPMLIMLNLETIILVGLVYLMHKETTFKFGELLLDARERAFLVIPVLLPVLSIIGVNIMNSSGNNILLVMVFLIIVAYVLFLVLYRRDIPERIYPPVVYIIGISILLMYTLRSSHIIGSDTHLDFFIFQSTLTGGVWLPQGVSPVDSCLIISIVPSVYHSIMNLEPEMLFRLIFLPLQAFTPVVVYIISSKYVGGRYGFLTAFLFISGVSFLSGPEASRMHIAVLFFAIIIMAMFHDGFHLLGKKILVIAFFFGIILIHYSSAYIAGIILTFGLIISKAAIALIRRNKELPDGEYQEATGKIPGKASSLSGTVIVIFWVAVFFWYSQITGPSFRAGVSFFKETLTRIPEILYMDSKGAVVQAALGATLPYAIIPQRIEYYFSWLVIIFISLGLGLTIISLVKKCFSSPFKTGSFFSVSQQIEIDYLGQAFIGFIILILSTILPYVSIGYELTRTFFLISVVLSVFLVITGIKLSSIVKIPSSVLILAVVVPYFLCTTGMVGVIWNYPRTIILNSEGQKFHSDFTYDEESHAARWLREFRDTEQRIYSIGSARRLVSQVMIPESENYFISPLKLADNPEKYYGYLYVSYLHFNYYYEDNQGFYDRIATSDRIYTSGESEIYILERQ